MVSINDPTRKTPTEWATEAGYLILDPDGWRGEGDPDFDEPLTLAEFLPRFFVSTVGRLHPTPDQLRDERNEALAREIWEIDNGADDD